MSFLPHKKSQQVNVNPRLLINRADDFLNAFLHELTEFLCSTAVIYSESQRNDFPIASEREGTSMTAQKSPRPIRWRVAHEE